MLRPKIGSANEQQVKRAPDGHCWFVYSISTRTYSHESSNVLLTASPDMSQTKLHCSLYRREDRGVGEMAVTAQMEEFRVLMGTEEEDHAWLLNL